MINNQGFGTKDDSRARAGAIGRHARTSRSSTHVTEGKCPRSRSPTPPPRARFSSPSTYATNAVILASRPRDGCARSNGSSVRDRSIGGLDGGSIDESFLKKSRGSSNFPTRRMDGYDSERPNDGTDDDGTDGTDDANDANDATDVNNLNAFRVFFSRIPGRRRPVETRPSFAPRAKLLRCVRYARYARRWDFRDFNRPRTSRRTRAKTADEVKRNKIRSK